nr:Hsp20/alpha crystallin family protein [Halogeometricum sp. CBA1124]
MLPDRPANSWTQGLDFPSQLFATGSDDYELYEEDGEFVLSVEMPGFDPEEITVTWDDSILNVAAEREDETRGRPKTYHRRFRFPKRRGRGHHRDVQQRHPVQVTLPVVTGTPTTGKEIPIQS